MDNQSCEAKRGRKTVQTIRHHSSKFCVPILEGTPPGVGGCLVANRGKSQMLPSVEIAAGGGEKKIQVFWWCLHPFLVFSHTPHSESARLSQQWIHLRRFATRGNIWILLTCRLWKTMLGFCRIENVCNKINCRWWKSLILHEWRYRLWPNCPVVEFPDSPRVAILPLTELSGGGIP